MRRDFIVYPTRREQVGIVGLIIDTLFGRKKVKSTLAFTTARTRRGERPGINEGVRKCNKIPYTK
jgi:hypothetical protein